MIGLNAEFEYPSHDKILKVWPPMQVLQNAATMFTQKNGTQHTVKKSKVNINFLKSIRINVSRALFNDCLLS